MNIKVVGIDLAKNVFQVCVCLENNLIQSNRKLTRNKLLNYIIELPKGTLTRNGGLWYGSSLGSYLYESRI